MQWKGLPIVIFGTGGIALETYYAIKGINQSNYQQMYDVIGFVEDSELQIGKLVVDNKYVVASDGGFSEFSQAYAVLGAIIPFGNPIIKEKVCKWVTQVPNLVFPNIIHPSAINGIEDFKIGVGNVIGAGVTMTCGITIGDFNLINLQVSIGHDTQMGSYNVINPLACISGNVVIEDSCLIGTSAALLQQKKVGSRAVVGAGAVVTKDVESGDTVVGVPAKSMK